MQLSYLYNLLEVKPKQEQSLQLMVLMDHNWLHSLGKELHEQVFYHDSLEDDQHSMAPVLMLQ